MAKARERDAELGMVTLLGCRCRCGHEWLPRVSPDTGERERPVVCPKCKSPRWDKPKRD
jgi:hypothetical protein